MAKNGLTWDHETELDLEAWRIMNVSNLEKKKFSMIEGVSGPSGLIRKWQDVGP